MKRDGSDYSSDKFSTNKAIFLSHPSIPFTSLFTFFQRLIFLEILTYEVAKPVLQQNFRYRSCLSVRSGSVLAIDSNFLVMT